MANCVNLISAAFYQMYAKIYYDDRKMPLQDICGNLNALKVKIDEKIRIWEGLSFSTKIISMDRE